MSNGNNNHVMFKKPRYCPNASSIGFSRPYVAIGSIVTFRTATEQEGVYHYQLGKVLCGVRRDGCGKAYEGEERLLVLAANDCLRFGYERHVRLSDIVDVPPAPGAFARWFLFGDTPDPDVALKVIKYGAMCDSYLDPYLDGAEGQIRADWHEVAMKRAEPRAGAKPDGEPE